MISEQLLRSGVRTPFLAISRDQLRSNLDRWRKHLPDVAPYYAVKANIDPLVTGELGRNGAGADVASCFELDTAAAVGFTGERMILSNPRKDLDTIRAVAHFRPFATTVDSEDEILRLTDSGLPTADYRPVIFVRIKVPTRGVKQDLSSKFGIRVLESDSDSKLRLSELLSVFEAAKRAGFTEFGLAFHVGTQCFEPRVYQGALAICRKVSRALEPAGLTVKWVDLGGGFPDGRIAAQHSDQLDDALRETASKLGNPAAFDSLLDQTPHDKLLHLVGLSARALVKDGYRVIAEPGRYLVADAGTLVTQVVYDRATEITGRRVQIDDGVYRTLSGRVHDDRDFQFTPLRIAGDRPPFSTCRISTAVWGCSCDSFDKVADSSLLPADITIGDYLLADCVGAYSSSFGSNTNGFQPAPAVMYWHENGTLRWEVSPLARQNEILLAHIRGWAATRGSHA
jgi:ornithine decarboxylase